jgi:protein ImuB
LDAPNGLILDIAGCAHLFGGETALARDLVVRLKRQGLQARVAIADTVGCACAVARYSNFGALIDVPSPLEGEGGRSRSRQRRGEGSWPIERPSPLTQPRLLNSRRSPLPQGERAREAGAVFAGSVCTIPPGKAEAAMLPLPVMALRIEPETAAGLAAMGLKRVADLVERPRAPLAARFGEMLVRRLDQALGHEDEPITPRLPLPQAIAEQRFAEPIALEACVLGTIEQLARQLAGVLERRGEGARLVQVALFRTDGAVHRLEIGTGAPLRQPARLRKLFEDRLATLGDACDPGFGYDVVRFSALVTERCDPVQAGFADDDAADRGGELAHLIDRLGARFGLRRVSRLVPQDTHIPEFAVMAVPAHAARHACAVGPHLEQDSLSAVRPIRLFERPEPIEAVAQVPDGPPVRFSWRHVTHRVAQAEGPERIAMEWWRDDRGNKLTRDYFRVESHTGARVWLYREGLYGREPGNPRWYLHGLFA